MSNKNKKPTLNMETVTTPAPESASNVTVETVSTSTVTPDVETVTTGKTPGRPIMANSKRQQQLLEKEMRKLSGEGGKKGRPVSADSKRQKREQELAAKRAAGELKPGRPAYTPEQKAKAAEEKKQREEAERARITAIATRLKNEGITDPAELQKRLAEILAAELTPAPVEATATVEKTVTSNVEEEVTA